MHNSAFHNLLPCHKVQPVYLRSFYCCKEILDRLPLSFSMLQSSSLARYAISVIIILLASQCTSFIIHPNCQTEGEIHSNHGYLTYLNELIFPLALLNPLQKLVAGANFLSLRAATQNLSTGNWVDTDILQAAYNRAAVPDNRRMTQVEGRSAWFYLLYFLTSPQCPKNKK